MKGTGAMNVVSLQLAERNGFSGADEMGRWLDHVLGPNYHHFRGKDTWRPAINLYEEASSFFIVADLAGVAPEEIELHLEERTLVLQGTRKAPRPPEGGQACTRDPGSPLRVHLMEIDEGRFLRKLDLPDGVNSAAIEACYRNGMLWVKMPKGR